MKEIKRIVVVGASAGGLQAICNLLDSLRDISEIAVFVVLHVSKKSAADVLAFTMQKHTTLKCKVPVDMEQVNVNHLYVAPPDYHMLLKDDYIRITYGPPENRWRPSIDVLFRSAAATYSHRVIGIILTGLLDDGTSGMAAIKSSGGKTIVQEPAEAQFDDMPRSVLSNVDVDYRVPISDMGYILKDLQSHPEKTDAKVPEEVRIEAEITERMASSIDNLREIGKYSDFTCPDCGGGLWLMNDKSILRYRCHTGHVYTEKALHEKQSEEMEETLWVAVRMLEERRNLMKVTAMHSKERGFFGIDEDRNKRIEELEVHIKRMKEMIISFNKRNSDNSGFS